MSLQTKELDFATLVGEVKICTQCERMNESVRVLGSGSGSLASRIFIIGEAPGRLGADASEIPFHGDKAGDNFESLLEQAGLSRHDCFITNAALCNPKDENGNNATPKRQEVQNCSSFLKRQLDLVNPKIVVTLGAQALNAIKLIEPHEIELSLGLRKAWNWHGRILIPLYHPGQRAMIHRSFFNQLTDYRFLAETYLRLDRIKRPVGLTATSETIAKIAARLTSQAEAISYFSLHKLFYLAECEFYRQYRRRMTSAYIVRQKEGPYVFEMHIKKLMKALQTLEIRNRNGRLLLRNNESSSLFKRHDPEEFDDVLEHVEKKYGQLSDADLKRVVYLTAPMRAILRNEKNFRANDLNRAIDFSHIKNVN